MSKPKWHANFGPSETIRLKSILEEMPGWLAKIAYGLLANGWKRYNNYSDESDKTKILWLYLDESKPVDSCDLIIELNSSTFQQIASFRIKAASDIHVKRVLTLRSKTEKKRLEQFVEIYKKHGNGFEGNGPFDIYAPAVLDPRQ